MSLRRMNTWVLLLLLGCSVARGDDFAALCADRAAIERVYYNHRLGEKPAFEQALPGATLERLVRDDQRKEAALKKVYGIEITSALLDAEVQRINTTTRAPEILAELKATLEHDANRFARTVAKPILVERLLRDRFENDDALHAPQRGRVEQTRDELLAAKQGGADCEKLLALLKQSHSNAVTETTWQLAARQARADPPSSDEIEIKKRFGPAAQVLSSAPAAGTEQKLYFEDLPVKLQQVLRVQLRQSGEVSAVIEMPGGFALYVARERTDTVLHVAALSLSKRSYEQWLEEQTKRQ